MRAALCALGFACLGAAAQTSREPLDVDTRSLGPNYRGHDCERIAARLRAAAPRKTEFDSSADFAQRAAAMAGATLDGHVKIGDTVAFVPDPSLVTFTYDADKRAARIFLDDMRLMATRLSADSGWMMNAVVPIKDRELSRRAFVGTNAFGVKVQAVRSTRSVCAVLITNKEQRAMGFGSFVELPMEPEVAKSFSENRAVAIVGTVVPPFHTAVNSAHAATIDSPYEVSTSGTAIVFELKDFWYFNRRTGQVLTTYETNKAQRWPTPGPASTTATDAAK